MVVLIVYLLRAGERLRFLPFPGLGVPAAPTPRVWRKAGGQGVFVQGQFLGVGGGGRVRSAACGHAAYRGRDDAGGPVGCRECGAARGHGGCRGVLPFPAGRVGAGGARGPFVWRLRKTFARPPGLSEGKPAGLGGQSHSRYPQPPGPRACGQAPAPKRLTAVPPAAPPSPASDLQNQRPRDPGRPPR